MTAHSLLLLVQAVTRKHDKLHLALPGHRTRRQPASRRDGHIQFHPLTYSCGMLLFNEVEALRPDVNVSPHIVLLKALKQVVRPQHPIHPRHVLLQLTILPLVIILTHGWRVLQAALQSRGRILLQSKCALLL